jgi:hypothetical protein
MDSATSRCLPGAILSLTFLLVSCHREITKPSSSTHCALLRAPHALLSPPAFLLLHFLIFSAACNWTSRTSHSPRPRLGLQAASLQGGGDLSRLPLLESECTAASAQLRRALCLSEMTLALIVDSVAIQMGSSPSVQGGALPSPGGAGGDQFQVLGSTVSCSHKLWNRSRFVLQSPISQFLQFPNL